MSTVSDSSPGSTRQVHTTVDRCYRLVDLSGEPHPVLDGIYESREIAWNEALRWCQDELGASTEPMGIGIEVSTRSGTWRTLRYPTC